MNWFTQEGEEWTPMVEIPEGSHIIGIKCDTESRNDYITNIIFLLARRGVPEITGELRFPPVKAFIYEGTDNFEYPSIATINYKYGGIFDALTGFQLVFSDGKESPLI